MLLLQVGAGDTYRMKTAAKPQPPVSATSFIRAQHYWCQPCIQAIARQNAMCGWNLRMTIVLVRSAAVSPHQLVGSHVCLMLSANLAGAVAAAAVRSSSSSQLAACARTEPLRQPHVSQGIQHGYTLQQARGSDLRHHRQRQVPAQVGDRHGAGAS